MIIFVFSNRFTLIFHGLSRVVWLFKLRLINFFLEKIVGMCVHALTHEIHLCTLDATSSWYHVSFHHLSDVPLLFFFSWCNVCCWEISSLSLIGLFFFFFFFFISNTLKITDWSSLFFIFLLRSFLFLFFNFILGLDVWYLFFFNLVL